MTSITLTGNLNMISTNGDGPQMLTEAAEFVAALAQMGVVVGVEINLRPVAPPAPLSTAKVVKTEELAPPANPQTPSLKEAGARPDLSASMSRDEQRLFDALSSGEVSWRKLSESDRISMIAALGCSMTLYLGRPVKMGDWDSLRPTWAPSVSALPMTYAESWKALADQWSVELT